MEDVVIILENILDEETIQVLQKDCDIFKVKRSQYNPSEVGAAIDPLEEVDIPEDSPIRTSADDYFKIRWRDALPSNISPHLSPHERQVFIDLITRQLPSILVKYVCNLRNTKEMFLFNEHYIVKDGGSGVAFRWHRDADEQLYAFPTTHRPLYWSLWCPLEDCNEMNGTLYVSDRTAILYPEDDLQYCSRKRKAETALESEQLFHDSYPGVPIVASRGTIVIFSSMIWHRSGVNASSSSRRVFYAQYSDGVISPFLPINDGKRPSGCDSENALSPCPLNLAVPCVISREFD